MLVAVLADEVIRNEFEGKGFAEGTKVHFISSLHDVNSGTDVLFYLLPEQASEKILGEIKSLGLLTFMNAVVTTSGFLPANCIRLNSWPGFLQRNIVEIYSTLYNQDAATRTLNALGWKFILVPDIPGMITARIIAMIINEAYFALQDEVGTSNDIDIAMKLGTNYPFGPFEWAQKIGLQNVISLLLRLSETDTLYTPSPALLHKIHNKLL